ncbi:MAG: hypothetical protein ACM3ML_01565 [Micromonosporaceae bacterium]
MEPHASPAAWIEGIGWFSLAIAFASALAITADIAVAGYRQKMPIMNLVYPIAALYWGPAAAWFYFRHGRRQSQRLIKERGEPDPDALPAGTSYPLPRVTC